MYPSDFNTRFSSAYLSDFVCSRIIICEFWQSRLIFDACFSFSYSNYPHPIAAGNPNSAQRIAICEATPPYFVIKPEG